MNPGDQLDPKVVDALLARERLSLVGRLLPGVVHNLSGALQMMRLPLDLMEMRLADGDYSGLSKGLANVNDGVNRLTSEMELLADKVRQAQDYKPSSLDLSSLVEEQLGFWRADSYFKHEVTLNNLTQYGLAKANAAYLDVALAFNALLANALDEIRGEPGGSVTLELAAGNGRVELQVSDSGPGPSPELGDGIFDPFVTSRGGEHDGLGLFLASRALARWDGRISWQPAPDKKFVISLPQA